MSRLPRALASLWRPDLALGLSVVAVIAMMIVPLPTPLIDLLIALNLGFGVALLASALYVRDALSFAVFPTLLLLSTLYRLALNVSSTRLILLQADAGRVIESFGSFVVRGDYRVGALVFAMLTLIQFIVIARGAERVAEVAARFSLDALPGKQLAIDADLRTGALSPERARARRHRLERESQLYGALDGALKFVKGDAVAGIIITVVNFAGGVAIGVFGRDLDLQTSLQTYGILTIGDGLVTQVPALLGATAAGLLVTRVAPEHGDDSLARDIALQLLSQPRALLVCTLVLASLALVPALPTWPFLAIACAAAAAAYAGFTRARLHDRETPLEPLTLALDRQLAASLLVRGRPSPRLRASLDALSTRIATTLGVTCPPARVTLDHGLAANTFRIDWRELPAHTARLERNTAPLETIVAAIERVIRARADECLDVDGVQRMLDALARTQPTLVRLTVPEPVPLLLLTDVLRGLAREGVSVRWLAEILQAIEPGAQQREVSGLLVERARRALSHRISHMLAGQRTLHLLRLAPEVEEALADALRTHDGNEVLIMAPDLADEIVSAVEDAHRSAPAPNALVTQPALRRHVRSLLADRVPNLSVVSAYELVPTVAVSTSDPIGP